MRILATDAASSASAIFWSVVLVVILVAGFAIVAYMKKKMRDDEDDGAPAPAAGFTLSDLRRMHEAGQISPDEFERAKRKIVASAQAGALGNAPRPPRPAPRRRPDANDV